jgi:hypothetical protein
MIKFKQKVITIYTVKVTQLRGLMAQPFMFLCKPNERLCGFSHGTSAHGTTSVQPEILRAWKEMLLYTGQ